MAIAPMTRARWTLRQALQSVGLPGWVAMALGLAVAVGAWGVIEPMRAEVQRLDHAHAALLHRVQAGAGSKVAVEATPQQQLTAFAQRFPGEQGIAPALRRLHAVALRRGVRLDQAEFKFAREPTELLARYSIILPVKGDYRALRRFTRDALRELPGLAVEEVNLRRNDPKTPQLDAQLRFVLFVTQPALPAATRSTDRPLPSSVAQAT